MTEIVAGRARRGRPGEPKEMEHLHMSTTKGVQMVYLNQTKAVHTWSLFRVLGSFVAPGTMPSLEGRSTDGGTALALLDLPEALASRGYTSAQLCHFSLLSKDAGYLAELRAAFASAGVDIECFLVDHGDLADLRDGERWIEWISDWVRVGEVLGAGRVRVSAGNQAPTAATIARSVTGLRALAARHDGIRILVENWQRLVQDAGVALEILDRCDGQIGFLADFGNWTGPGKYDELTRVVAVAESCQAKVRTRPDHSIDAEDFAACLDVMRSAGYTAPLSLVYDRPEGDVWSKLDEVYALVPGRP